MYHAIPNIRFENNFTRCGEKAKTKAKMERKILSKTESEHNGLGSNV